MHYWFLKSLRTPFVSVLRLTDKISHVFPPTMKPNPDKFGVSSHKPSKITISGLACFQGDKAVQLVTIPKHTARFPSL